MSPFLQDKNDFLGDRGLKESEKTMRQKKELSIPMKPKVREMTKNVSYIDFWPGMTSCLCGW